MKRKITKIGTLLASVALLFGATSWANAQSVTITFSPNADCTDFESKIDGEGANAVEASFTKGEKLGALVKVTDTKSRTDFVGMTVVEALSNPTNCADFKITVKDENYAFTITKVSYEAVKSGTDAKGKGHGIYQQIAADSKKFWEGHVKADDIHRNNYDDSDEQHKDDGARLGHEIEKSVTCANTCDVYLGPGDHIGATKIIGIREIKIEGTVVKRVKVAYIAANANVEGKHIHPVYDALASDAAFLTELVVKPEGDALNPADFEGKYDVVLLGGSAGGKSEQASSFPTLAAHIPLLNVTKAFAYGTSSTDRSGWGSGQSGIKSNLTNNYVKREKAYRTHPVFDGFDKDSIVVFADYATHTSWNSVMQGYPTLSTKAPAHTTLGTSGVSTQTSNSPLVNSVAEAWVKTEAGDSIPYMLVAHDNDIIVNSDSLTQLTADGARLYKNAIRYLDTATVRYIPPIIGACPDPTVTFKQVKSKEEGGNTESDTLRWVLNIDVEKVFKDMNKKEEEKVAPTVTVTIGDGAAHAYNAAKPDTLWKPCNVKVLVESNFYTETEKTVEFKNEGLRKLDAPTPQYTAVNENPDVDSRKVLTFEVKSVKLDGKDTIPTVMYSIDGTDNLKEFNKKAPDTLELQATVKVQAVLDLYLSSDVVTTEWKNPDVKQVDKPEISAVKKNVPGSVYTVTITCKTEGAVDIYYTTNGNEPTASSTKYSEPFEILAYDAVTVKAIAKKAASTDSEVAVEEIHDADAKPLATPAINVSGNSFTITGPEGADIYYLVGDGTPSDKDGLKYTAGTTITYEPGTYTVKAIAIEYGFANSEVATQELSLVGEATAIAIPHYKSTFRADGNDADPTQVQDPTSHDYTAGWYRWVCKKYDPETKNVTWEAGTNGQGPTEDRAIADKYITDAEWLDATAAYYDDQGSPRLHIFRSGDKKGGWHVFNNWSFWSGGNSRRIIAQNNISSNSENVSDGALYFLGSEAKVTAGPDSLFQGPFAVVINIGAGENFFNEKNTSKSAKMDVCLANEPQRPNEMLLSTVACGNGELVTDTIYYYGDQKVCVRLRTTSKELVLCEFEVLYKGAPLKDLEWTIDPEAGTTAADAKEVQRGLDKITITFNNPVTVTSKTVNMALLKADGSVDTDPNTRITGSVAQGEANEVVITLDTPIAAADGTKYLLNLPKETVEDAAGHKNSTISMYYVVKGGAAAIDEVSAAKEVVATYIYSISGAQMNTLAPGVNIVKKVYSDGTTTTEKVQVK